MSDDKDRVRSDQELGASASRPGSAALVCGLGFGLWTGSWFAVAVSPFALFILSYPVMLVGLLLVVWPDRSPNLSREQHHES